MVAVQRLAAVSRSADVTLRNVFDAQPSTDGRLARSEPVEAHVMLRCLIVSPSLRNRAEATCSCTPI